MPSGTTARPVTSKSIVFIFLCQRVETEVVIVALIFIRTSTFEVELPRNTYGVLAKLQVVVIRACLSSHSIAILIVGRPALALIRHAPLRLQLEKDERSADLKDG